MITYVNTKISTPVLGAVAATVLALSAAQAHGGNARTWISGKGVDQAGCGPIASPCRTMQYAHDNTNAGGEIDVLDSAGYGAVTITKGISIVGDGVIAGLLAGAGTNAVTVSVGSNDTVILRGLTIEGNGVGQTGILMTSGGMLDVANCVVQNFGSAGVVIVNDGSANSNVQIVNTTSSSNALGFIVEGVGGPSKTNLVFDHVVASQNREFGIGVFVIPGATANIVASVSDSLLSLNGFSGLAIIGNAAASATVNVDHSRAVGNVQDGVVVGAWNGATSSPGRLVIGRSVISDNGFAGLENGAGTIQSYGDNRIVGNSQQTAGTIGTIAAQ